jgi:hypothetical protein
MQNLLIKKTLTSPEIYFSPEENEFFLRGTSAPEDVRALYYPVIDWIKIFIDDVLGGNYKKFDSTNPIRFQIDLSYFNSSSAKFLFDILSELKRLHLLGTPVVVEWYYEDGDPDMKDAGSDISLLVGMEFSFFSKQKNK